jgi:hypothetical protein
MMSEEDVKNHHKMVEELKKREQKTDNLQVTLYNWGPCVVKFKIKDNFQKMLEAEAKLAEGDFTKQLAGQLDKELGFTTESKNKILPYLAPYLGAYDNVYERFRGKKYDKKPEYFMSAMWINYQRQYDFNPPHDHDGALSFIIYINIPEILKKENAAYIGNSCGPGGVQMMWGDGPRGCMTNMSHFPEKGDMFIFPAWLKHWVSPYKSDCVRVSISGNIHDSAQLNNIEQHVKDKT